MTTNHPDKEEVFCVQCHKAGEETKFVRSSQDDMMKHYLMHLPLDDVPTYCPCDTAKHRFNSLSALKKHANKYKKIEGHLKHKLNFSSLRKPRN